MGLVDSIRERMAGQPAPRYGAYAPPAHPTDALLAAPGGAPGDPAQAPGAAPAPAAPETVDGEWVIDLERRRDQLSARVAELQWDLGGLVYEMAIRDRVRVDVLIKRAAALQNVDAELGEVERILRMEKTGVAGTCTVCEAPHSSGAVYCWQCGTSLLEQVPSDTISSL
jgi:hypothetical protein